MRNFFRVCQGLQINQLMTALARQPELWNQQTLRTNHPQTAHGEVDDIWLRFQDISKLDLTAVVDEHESINYPAMALLPQARDIIFPLMALVQGERLGRVLITRLAPGKRIAPHVDGGTHAAYYDRYHVALQVHPGVLFRCGDETPAMQTGDVWWFDNSKEHEVVNNSAEDRITLIIDIRTFRQREKQTEYWFAK